MQQSKNQQNYYLFIFLRHTSRSPPPPPPSPPSAQKKTNTHMRSEPRQMPFAGQMPGIMVAKQKPKRENRCTYLHTFRYIMVRGVYIQKISCGNLHIEPPHVMFLKTFLSDDSKCVQTYYYF